MANTNLIDLAVAATKSIEEAAKESGATYSAAQTFYGVEVEALVDDEWVRVSDMDDEDKPEVEAVRLFDCDGERGLECRSAEEIEAERATWTSLIEG